MRILVLDTIHGGGRLVKALRDQGHISAGVDVYRDGGDLAPDQVDPSGFDLMAVPVHLDPDHPLLSLPLRVVSHHECTRMILADQPLPTPFVEVTGRQGKTTTACAIAATLPGRGVLHTSSGTFTYPGKKFLYRASITPANLLDAVSAANRVGGWLVAEVSLGVCGAGDLAVITSDRDYPIAAGKKRALYAKMASAAVADRLICPETLPCPATHPSDLVTVEGTGCRYRSGSFDTDLLATEPYRSALPLAAAAALLIGGDPGLLADFSPVPGRMVVSRNGGRLIVDDSNSGVDADTLKAAAAAGRGNHADGPFVIVTGQEFGAVCEGFPADKAAESVFSSGPDAVVVVGTGEYGAAFEDRLRVLGFKSPVFFCRTLAEGINKAEDAAPGGTIISAVKTWR